MTMERTLPLICFALAGSVATGQVIVNEDFESYTVGSTIAASNPAQWSTWSGGVVAEDATISNAYASSGTQSIAVIQTAAAGGPVDCLLLLGDSANGSYTLSWKMYIPAGKGGYFNIQHLENPGVEFAAEFVFRLNGTVLVTAAGDTASAPYPHGQWFQVDLTFLLDEATPTATFNLDQAPVHSWAFNTQTDGTAGTNALGSIDFFAYAGTNAADGEYYVDDVHYEKLGGTGVGEPGIPGVITYPNPVTDRLWVEWPAVGGAVQVTLCDAAGRSIEELRPTGLAAGGRLGIDMGALPAGVYGLRVSDGVRSGMHRVVKR